MLNLGNALFSEKILGVACSSDDTTTHTDLNDGTIVRLNIKTLHKSEQRSSERFHVTWRKIKPMYLDWMTQAIHAAIDGGNVSSAGFNIYSRSKDGNGLAAALTNPTELSRKARTIQQDYPISIYGATFESAEQAYQALKKQFKPTSERQEDALMVQVIVAKFKQHPRLFEALSKLGGLEFIKRCRHHTYARTAPMQAWEGEGLQSRMIRNLHAAYMAREAEKEKEE